MPWKGREVPGIGRVLVTVIDGRVVAEVIRTNIMDTNQRKEDQSLLAYIVAITKSAQCVYVSFNYCIVSFGAVKYLIKFKDLTSIK